MGGYISHNIPECFERKTIRQGYTYIVYYTDGESQLFQDEKWPVFLEHSVYRVTTLVAPDISKQLKVKHGVDERQRYMLYVSDDTSRFKTNDRFYPSRGNVVLTSFLPLKSEEEANDVSDVIRNKLDHVTL